MQDYTWMRNASHNTRNTFVGIMCGTLHGQTIEALDVKEGSIACRGSACGVSNLRFDCLSLESDKQALGVFFSTLCLAFRT
jgi:hypothetical protein